MSEIIRLLTRELEALRAEDRRREAALTQLLDGFSQQFAQQQERDEDVTEKLQVLVEALIEFNTRLKEFETRLSELAESLKKP